jgi:plasmid replication initiation protein
MQDNYKIIKVSASDNDLVARRRNELVLGNMRMSLQAHRLFLYILSQVRDDHDETTEYEFSVNELATTIGIDRSKLYKTIADVLDELARIMVNVEVLGEDGTPLKDRFVRIGLIRNRQQIRVGEKGQNFLAGHIAVSMYKELLPYVRRLKERFTETDLKYVFRLGSSYSQRLYDLLKAHAFKGRPWRVEREALLKLLVIEDKFQLWGDFRRYVLERAQREINAHTDLAFDLSYHATGRTVTEIVFTLRKEGGNQVELMPGTLKHQSFKAMLDLGLDAKAAENILTAWWDGDPDRVRWHIGEARRLKEAGKIKSAPGWLTSGIQTDYRPQRSLFADITAGVQAKRESYKPLVARDDVDPLLQTSMEILYKRLGMGGDEPSSRG